MPYTYEYPHPAVTVDVVILTSRGGALEALLVRRGKPPFEGRWALPGGFVEIDESLKHAAWRELREETGVSAAWLEQLHAFGNPGRDPRERVISIAYLSLVPADRLTTEAGSDAAEVGWFDLAALPGLAFDHDRIVGRALGRLRDRSRQEILALRLMPVQFTMPELTRAHESLLGERIDRRNFRKRALATGLLAKTGRRRRAGAHRPASLYRLRDAESA